MTLLRMNDADIFDRFTKVLSTEAQAINTLIDLMKEQHTELLAACKLVLNHCTGSPGRLAVTGVGKAGLIGRKITATAASVGTPAFFIHPTEAYHGDLGMLQEQDVVLALSNSGSSEEITALLPHIKRIGCKTIAVVGRNDSPLGQHADIILNIGKVIEACPLGLAPSTSTTAMLAMGDALALTVLEMREFTPEHYARFHPGGALGRKLMTCGEVMRPLADTASVKAHTPLITSMHTVTEARCGSALIIDDDHQLLGIFTDGDLRRALTSDGEQEHDANALLKQPVANFGTLPCTCVHDTDLVEEAIRLCSQIHTNNLPVIGDQGQALGLIDLQDLANRGFDITP